jgi:small subunit ribosomal protein S1
VTKVVTFGAFVEIHAGVEGLVHISELAEHHVENPREVVNQGDELEVRIIEIDADRRRLSLSLKRVTPAPEGYEAPSQDDQAYDEQAELAQLAQPAAVTESPESPESDEAPEAIDVADEVVDAGGEGEHQD